MLCFLCMCCHPHFFISILNEDPHFSSLFWIKILKFHLYFEWRFEAFISILNEDSQVSSLLWMKIWSFHLYFEWRFWSFHLYFEWRFWSFHLYFEWRSEVRMSKKGFILETFKKSLRNLFRISWRAIHLVEDFQIDLF